MDINDFRSNADAIFNSDREKATSAHHLIASLAGGEIADSTNVDVIQDGDNYVISLSQEGLFPQSCFHPLFGSRDWAQNNGGSCEHEGDGGKNEWATITVPVDSAESYLSFIENHNPLPKYGGSHSSPEGTNSSLECTNIEFPTFGI